MFIVKPEIVDDRNVGM